MFCTVILGLAMTGQAPAPAAAPARRDSHACIDTQIFDLLWKGYADGYLAPKDRKELERARRLHPECYESLRSYLKFDAMPSSGPGHAQAVATWREQIRLFKLSERR